MNTSSQNSPVVGMTSSSRRQESFHVDKVHLISFQMNLIEEDVVAEHAEDAEEEDSGAGKCVAGNSSGGGAGDDGAHGADAGHRRARAGFNGMRSCRGDVSCWIRWRVSLTSIMREHKRLPQTMSGSANHHII